MRRTLYLGLFLLVLALVLTSHDDVDAFLIASRSSRVSVAAGRTITTSSLNAVSTTKSKTTDGSVEETASSGDDKASKDDAIENDKEETTKEEENENLMEKIKESGVAGIISYAAWEFAFWAVSVPVCVLGYKEVTGHWPDINDKDDVSKLGAEAFAFVNFARFAVPLRIGLALSTTPWIKENIVDRFGIDDSQDQKNEMVGNDENNDDETTTEVTTTTTKGETASPSSTSVVAEEEKDASTDPVEEKKILVEKEKLVVTAAAVAVAEEEKAAAAAKTVSIVVEETFEDPAETMKDLEEEIQKVVAVNESRFRIRSRVKNLVTRVVNGKRKQQPPDSQDISTAISNELMLPPPPDCQDISTAIASELETTK